MDEKVKKLIENEGLMEGLVTCNSPEELAHLLKANSIVLDDGLSIEEAFDLVKKQANGELDVAELDSVSGGIAIGLAITSAALFVVSAGMICFLAGYAYEKFRR